MLRVVLRTKVLSLYSINCLVFVNAERVQAIMSFYNNWFVFTNEAECVYCVVRTESLKNISGYS